MSEIKISIDLLYEIDKLPFWKVKKLLRNIRIYAMTGVVSDMPVKMYMLFEMAKTSIDKDKKVRERCKTNGKRGAKNRWNGKKMAKNSGAIAENGGAIHDSLPDFKAEIHNILGADYESLFST